MGRTVPRSSRDSLSPSSQSPRVYSIWPADLNSGYADSANAIAIATADFNGERHPDIVVATDFKLVIQLGTSAGRFSGIGRTLRTPGPIPNLRSRADIAILLGSNGKIGTIVAPMPIH